MTEAQSQPSDLNIPDHAGATTGANGRREDHGEGGEEGGGGGGWSDFVSRHGRWIRWTSVALIVVGVALLLRTLPLDQGVALLSSWVHGLGVWGPVGFGLIYVVLTILLLPASVLTIAGGAIFGLLWGTVIVSLASTTTAMIGFFIGRYLARRRVEQALASHPRFRAVDKAVEEGGWKVVAMLRLSPVIPFNIQNYIYGLTSLRFWSYALATWLFMLPGTFLYIYIGYLGRSAAVAAASGGGGTAGEGGGGAGAASFWKWVLLGVGLLATLALTVYLTRLARKQLKEQTNIENEQQGNGGGGGAEGAEETAPARDARQQGVDGTDGAVRHVRDQASSEHDSPAGHEPQKEPVMSDKRPSSPRPPWGTAVLALAGVLILGFAIFAQFNPAVISRPIAGLFGPPAVHAKEVYAKKPGGPTFDHSDFGDILQQVVVDNHMVDYAKLQKMDGRLKAYLRSLGKADFNALGRDEKLAFLINAYNACTLQLIVNNLPLQSIRDIPAAQRWQAKRWHVGRHVMSLQEIEDTLRSNFKEPRIHFAINCASIGCPPLRSEAYTGARIDQQLADQAKIVNTDGSRWFKLQPKKGVVKMTKVYKWYSGDFKQSARSVLDFAARYSPRLKRMLKSGHKPSIQWLDYDWSLDRKGALQK